MNEDVRPAEGEDDGEKSDAENAALMEHLERTIPPADLDNSKKLLLEAKQIFDDAGVVFFLRQGTCLGAVRDHALIPWDDDIDIGSIYGLHGFTEELIEPTIAAFRANDCFVKVHREGLYTFVRIMKYRIRIDWQCYRVIKGTIAHYPGVPFPVDLFRDLEEVDFLGSSFRVPSPPEDYLRYKYGPNWSTPKQVGYEKDVLDNMPSGTVPGRAGWLLRFLYARFSPTRTARLLVLDERDRPVARAHIRIAGLGRARTNAGGYARFYLPASDLYALVITTAAREDVLYEESMAPGITYVYRPDPEQSEGRYFILTEQESQPPAANSASDSP